MGRRKSKVNILKSKGYDVFTGVAPGRTTESNISHVRVTVTYPDGSLAYDKSRRCKTEYSGRIKRDFIADAYNRIINMPPPKTISMSASVLKGDPRAGIRIEFPAAGGPAPEWQKLMEAIREATTSGISIRSTSETT
jgi:hypothetical protein